MGTILDRLLLAQTRPSILKIAYLKCDLKVACISVSQEEL